jgi:replicative superfamily II helicase
MKYEITGEYLFEYLDPEWYTNYYTNYYSNHECFSFDEIEYLIDNFYRTFGNGGILTQVAIYYNLLESEELIKKYNISDIQIKMINEGYIISYPTRETLDYLNLVSI